MRHKTAGNIATVALSIPLIQRGLRAGRRVMRLALAAALLGARRNLAARGSRQHESCRHQKLAGRGGRGGRRVQRSSSSESEGNRPIIRSRSCHSVPLPLRGEGQGGER